MSNNRIFYAIKAGALVPDGIAAVNNTTHTLRGLQTIGITTSFTLDQVFEIGQLEVYDNVEDLPEIEVTLEKVFDGRPLLYHMATPTASSSTLVGRSAEKVSFVMSIFNDTQDSASGTPLSQVNCSGMFLSALNYELPVDGNLTESVTLVGNNKTWRTSGFTFTGSIFDNQDAPVSGVRRRQHVVFGSGESVLPYGAGGIPGVSTVSGTFGNNLLVGGISHGASVQNISFSADLNRTDILELGLRNPFFRYVNFPVEVSADIEVLTKTGDFTEATEEGVAGNGNNLFDQPILVKIDDGTQFDLGARNKLTSVTYSGGEAGGDNATVTYSYVTFNNFTVTNPTDPAGL